MLVLTRKSGEQIVIDENVEVVVLEVRGDKVKLGLVAPREISIQREEIRGKVRRTPEQKIPGTPTECTNG